MILYKEDQLYFTQGGDVVKVVALYGGGMDIWSENKKQMRIYNSDGTLSNKQVRDWEEFTIIKECTIEEHPEEFI